jgi:outer membrane protein TolC
MPIDRRFAASDGLEDGVEIADSLESWIETALVQRTDLKRMTLELAVAQTEVKKMRAAYLPSISLTGDYMFNTEKFDDSADSYTIGAVVNFNLFAGLHDRSKVRESLAALDAARTARDQLERRIRVETRQAYLLAQSAWKRIQVVRDSLNQAEEALRIVGDRYNSGLLTVLDLLNSELELQQASTRHLTALQDYRVARAQLMLAAGALDETFE